MDIIKTNLGEDNIYYANCLENICKLKIKKGDH
jgi:hypothetical protein